MKSVPAALQHAHIREVFSDAYVEAQSALYRHRRKRLGTTLSVVIAAALPEARALFEARGYAWSAILLTQALRRSGGKPPSFEFTPHAY